MDAKNTRWIAAMGDKFHSTYKPAGGATMTKRGICDICDDHKEEYHTTCCSTAYCRHCLDRLFEEATREVSHPARCCLNGSPILLEGVEVLLSEKTTQRYKKAVAEFKVPARERTYCISCGDFAPISNTLTHTATCTSCKNSTCTLCKQGPHGGECSSTTADSEFKEVARKNGWQECPTCGYMIALVEGCDHMTCICGRDFCYICGKNNCGYRCTRPANQLQDLILEMRELSQQFHDDFNALYALYENLTHGVNARRFATSLNMYPDARRMAELGQTMKRMRTLPSEIRSHLELIHQTPTPASISSARTRQQSSSRELLHQRQHQRLQQMFQQQRQRRDEQQLQQQLQHDRPRDRGAFTGSTTAWDYSPHYSVQRPQDNPVSSAQRRSVWYGRRFLQEQPVSSPQHPAAFGSGPTTLSTLQTDGSNSVTMDSSEDGSFPHYPGTQHVRHNRTLFNPADPRHQDFYQLPQFAPRSPSNELLPPMDSLVSQNTGAHNTSSNLTVPNNMASLDAMLLSSASDDVGSQAMASQNMGPQGMATQSIAGQSPVTPSLATMLSLSYQASEQQTAELTRDDRQSSHTNDRGKRKADGESNEGVRNRGRGPY